MADFKQAYNLTAAIEGGYTVDNGGPTYKGISSKAWGNDELGKKIFKIVFAAKPRKGKFIQNDQLDQLVYAFYKKNFWDKIKGDDISNQTLANFLYDFYVNSGAAAFIVNAALGLGRSGSISTNTVKKLNTDPSIAYNVVKAARRNYFVKLGQQPQLKKYLKNWLERIDSFPETLTA